MGLLGDFGSFLCVRHAGSIINGIALANLTGVNLQQFIEFCVGR